MRVNSLLLPTRGNADPRTDETGRVGVLTGRMNIEQQQVRGSGDQITGFGLVVRIVVHPELLCACGKAGQADKQEGDSAVFHALKIGRPEA